MKKKFLKRARASFSALMALVMTSVLTLTSGIAEAIPVSAVYTDVEMWHWYYSDAQYVYDNGIMNGVDVSKFAPDSPLTRAMAVTILYRAAGEPALSWSNPHPFYDVESGQWYSDAVQWAYECGVVNGRDVDRFATDSYITRAELATVIARYASYFGVALPEGGASSLPDEDLVPDYAKAAVHSMYAAGIINGKENGCFDPEANVTRAETAAMIHRYILFSQNSGGTTGGTTAPPAVEEVSAAPEVTVCAQVADNIFIVGGICSNDTEYIHVADGAGNVTYIHPDYGESSAFFLGQVEVSGTTRLAISCKEVGKTLSERVAKMAIPNRMYGNLMSSDDYRPYFGLDSRVHFWSAILTYTCSDFVNDSIRSRALNNMSNAVASVKAANPNAEVIYLVVPSSASVYPETVPDKYPAATGETLYQAFESLAAQAGAKVIYPLSTLTRHKNDGIGYKIFNNTDSHWSTYGAYWGVSEMMDYISERYPAAAPRTVDEMGFYTKQMWGGDAIFSFSDGFENGQETGSTGETRRTKISELSTLYTRQMPTSTLWDVYRGLKSVYVDSYSTSIKTTVQNPDGAGLPTAMLIRDSFSCPAYDIVNDRFSTVYWQNSFDYTFPAADVAQNKPDYLIYLVSERNLLKIMMENDNMSLTNLTGRN